MERKVTNTRNAIRPKEVFIMTAISLARSKEKPNQIRSQKILIIGAIKSMVKKRNICRLSALQKNTQVKPL